MEENTEAPNSNEQTIFRNLYQTKILPPWIEKEHEDELEVHHHSPREYTIALTEGNADRFADITRVGWKGRVDYAMNEYMEEKGRAMACYADPFRNPNNLLQVAVSTIMLLASGATEVPKENFLYTELYMKHIKDENGDHPPNISQFLKHLRFLKKKQNIELDDEYNIMPPDELIITKISKKSKIPVKINRSSVSPKFTSSPRTSASPDNEEENPQPAATEE